MKFMLNLRMRMTVQDRPDYSGIILLVCVNLLFSKIFQNNWYRPTLLALAMMQMEIHLVIGVYHIIKVLPWTNYDNYDMCTFRNIRILVYNGFYITLVLLYNE